MRILLLTPQLPYPPHQGTSLRNYYILVGLAQRHEVTLMSFIETRQREADIAHLNKLARQVVTVPAPARSASQRMRQLLTSPLPDMAHRLASPEFDRALSQLLSAESFDVVQIEGLELARRLRLIREVSPLSQVVFDDHNAEATLQERALATDLRQPHRWPAALYSALQIGRLRRYERTICRRADHVVAVSERDRQVLQALAGVRQPITVIPNCLDVTAYQGKPQQATRHDLVFSGKMDYRPNVDAVLWFWRAVWPQLAGTGPLTWAIVGQKPHRRLAPLAVAAGITITGWVERVQPYLLAGSIFIMPFRIGSGTRLKLIEAMASGMAVVSTPVGAEGFPVVNGREIVLAETADEMATAIKRLLADSAERDRLGQAARQFARHYHWRHVIPLFEDVYRGPG